MAKRDRDFRAHRHATARRQTKRERGLGFSRADPAWAWLELTPAERREFERNVRTAADLANWVKRRREPP